MDSALKTASLFDACISKPAIDHHKVSRIDVAVISFNTRGLPEHLPVSIQKNTRATLTSVIHWRLFSALANGSLWPTAEKSGANIYTRCIVAFWQ
jgi:hypothetical protein